MDFFDYFFSLRIFWGCSFEAEIGPLSIYGVFRAIPALLHPVLEQISDLVSILTVHMGYLRTKEVFGLH